MDLEARYQHIVHELSLGHRALVRYSPDEIEFLKDTLSKEREPLKLEKVLCLVDHSVVPYGKLEDPIINLLNSDLPDHIIIFALNAARKHIILAKAQTGDRLKYEFLEVLKKNLHSQSMEVVEWTLRTIEECGNQGIYFLREFDKIKPAPWKWFNAHARAAREIIELLERRWRKFEKPTSK